LIDWQSGANQHGYCLLTALFWQSTAQCYLSAVQCKSVRVTVNLAHSMISQSWCKRVHSAINWLRTSVERGQHIQ